MSRAPSAWMPAFLGFGRCYTHRVRAQEALAWRMVAARFRRRWLAGADRQLDGTTQTWACSIPRYVRPTLAAPVAANHGVAASRVFITLR